MVYIFVLIILLVGLNYDKSSNTRGAKTWWRFEWLVLILLASFRYHVGGDTLSYSANYAYNPELSSLTYKLLSQLPNQPLWYVFCGLCKTISDEFWFFQLVHAVVLNTIIFWYIKRYSTRPFMAVLFYAIMLYPLYNMEILKQSLTLCCFLLSYPYLERREYKKYYIFAVIGYFFHTVGFLLFLLPPLYSLIYKRGGSNSFIYILVTIIGIALVSEFTSIGSTFNALGMVALSGKMTSYSEVGTANLYNGVLGMIYVVITRIIPLYLFLKFNRFNTRSQYTIVVLYFIFQGLGISLIFMHRVVELLNIPFYVVLVNSIDCHLINKGKVTNEQFDSPQIIAVNSRYAKYAVIILLTAVCYIKYSYYTYDRSSFNGGQSARFYHRYIPYYSVFDPQEDQRRENIYWSDFDNR